MSALVVIPVYLREPRDLEVTLQTIESVRVTEPDVEILVVDDCSPATALLDALASYTVKHGFTLHRKPENTGFSKTVNIGLGQALDWDKDAILLNADITCLEPGWVKLMQDQLDTKGRPASIVGALLLYPNGLIQHGGIYFSLLTRSFDHRYRFGPGELPEAAQTALCPVTGAFQFVRHECLEAVGLYDEDFQMGYEDVDFCLRVFESGRECIYQPRVRAVHHESLFRGRADEKLDDWQSESLRTLMRKHGRTNMSQFIMEVV